MKNRMFRMAARGTLITAITALSSFAAHAAGGYFSSPGEVSQDPDPMVGGTIPFGPPGVPHEEQNAPGAQGPLRADAGPASDPSIRDTDPLTVNGVWEQLPGDRVVNPVAQQQQQQSQPQEGTQPQSQ